MSDPSSTAGNGNSNGNSNDNSVTKTAGLVVFSGIAMSILKALNPFVPIDAIKEVNGLTGDTIYAGKKLIIP
ncbi:hypothetical protein C1H46_008865 [Malus baccata]|uniref:LysM domain-containing protein n=1 Tax=Malus baccata TaxID=106549 RepID=A0A540N4V0_MALBA|nr:hypothetical protein C1H46_008865 [Malus baccata]